jgi:transposase
MSYRIAGIDVHKKMLAVVVSDVEVDGEYQFERIRYGSTPEHLRLLAEWLIAQQVEEVVMESTAQYWKPVWGALERYWKPICQERESAGPISGTLHLAQAQSNRGRRGRKKDSPDAERLVKRLVANELTLSFVPDAEQRLWRTVRDFPVVSKMTTYSEIVTFCCLGDRKAQATLLVAVTVPEIFY